MALELEKGPTHVEAKKASYLMRASVMYWRICTLVEVAQYFKIFKDLGRWLKSTEIKRMPMSAS